ncbi:MAG TPA: hypothetical protein VIG88_07700 [Lysobacter sp.]
MNWHVYSIGPIDYGWHQLRTVRETLEVAAVPCEGSDPREGVDTSTSIAFLASWESAKEAALAAGWEGGFRLEPRVFWLPDDLQMAHGFVFKQDYNGATFVASPQPLPHLATLARG